eukprot:6476684-Amphidinium_carterae.1
MRNGLANDPMATRELSMSGRLYPMRQEVRTSLAKPSMARSAKSCTKAKNAHNSRERTKGAVTKAERRGKRKPPTVKRTHSRDARPRMCQAP